MIEPANRCVLVIALATLAACAGRRPEPPANAAVVPSANWLAEPELRSPRAPEEWLAAFDDPALIRLVDEALANSVDLSLAAARIDEARAQFRLTRAQRGINVSGYMDGVRERSIQPAYGVPVEQSAGDAGIAISYDADVFGRLANLSAAARASLLASQASRETVRIAVLTAVVEGYIVLCSLDERLRILDATLAARADEVRFTRRRSSVGYAPVVDLRQAEAAYKAAEQQVPAVKLLIARQEHAVSTLLGVNPREIERGRAFAKLGMPAPMGELPSELLSLRPDIVQAQQQLIAADRTLDASRAAFLPSIQLKATGGWVASTLLKGDPIAVFAAGGSILAPLFDSGRLHAQQEMSAARRDQAALTYRKVVLGAFREVEDALASMEQHRAALRIIEAQREDLARVLELATKRYRAGYSPYLEQLEAQRALLAAELSAVQARTDLLLSSVALYRGVGAGWRAPTATTPR